MSTASSEAWLIVAQGGWWTASEVMEHMPSGMEVDDPTSLMWTMERRHKYLTGRGYGRGKEYAVTPDCIAPPGIPVRRIVQALAVETREAA